MKMMRGLASKIPDEVLREVAKMCLLEKEVDRPEMQRVVHVLQGTDTSMWVFLKMMARKMRRKALHFPGERKISRGAEGFQESQSL